MRIKEFIDVLTWKPLDDDDLCDKDIPNGRIIKQGIDLGKLWDDEEFANKRRNSLEMEVGHYVAMYMREIGYRPVKMVMEFEPATRKTQTIMLTATITFLEGDDES